VGARRADAVGVLLDTHALLWWHAGGQRLSPTARSVIERAEALLVSPLSCWETATLHRLGRLVLDRDPGDWVRDLLREERVAIAPLSFEAAAWAGGLDASFPGDPIDRLLYATARDLRSPLVSKDDRLRAYADAAGDVDVVW
jgi:PIN domain nuclease of toxin-antitoxin system